MIYKIGEKVRIKTRGKIGTIKNIYKKIDEKDTSNNYCYEIQIDGKTTLIVHQDEIENDDIIIITNRIFKVLNYIKEFDLTMANSRKGRIVTRYNNVDFFITIEPAVDNNVYNWLERK